MDIYVKLVSRKELHINGNFNNEIVESHGEMNSRLKHMDEKSIGGECFVHRNSCPCHYGVMDCPNL